MTCVQTCVKPTPSNAHCGACHRTFAVVSTFDRHRRGGQCADPATIGMHTDKRGLWRMDGDKPHPDAPSVVWGLPQSDENGSGVPQDTLGGIEPLAYSDEAGVTYDHMAGWSSDAPRSIEEAHSEALMDDLYRDWPDA